MRGKQPCGAIAGRFCSGEMDPEDCDECMEFVHTCDQCFSAGSSDSLGWNEGPNGETLCDQCFSEHQRNEA
jgi:hypothetical protein